MLPNANEKYVNFSYLLLYSIMWTGSNCTEAAVIQGNKFERLILDVLARTRPTTPEQP